MARINFEDRLWSDARFLKLCVAVGDELRAIGAIVLGWKLQEQYWCPDRSPIPVAAFEASGLPEALVTVGLAERTDLGVRMRGAEEHFSWWFQRQEAGKRGGEARSKKRKQTVAEGSETKRDEPKPSKPKQTVAEPTGRLAERSKTYPLTLTLPLEETTTTTAGAPGDPPGGLRVQTQAAWDLWGETCRLCREPFSPGEMSAYEQGHIARAIKNIGFENVMLAIEGKRYDDWGGDVNAAKFMTLEYVLDRNLQTGKAAWTRLKALAQQHRARPGNDRDPMENLR